MSTAVLQERIGSVGDNVSRVEGKVDTLIDGFGKFQVRHAEQQSRLETTLSGLEEQTRNHRDEDDRRFRDSEAICKERHDENAKELKKIRSSAGGPTKAQAGGALIGAGALGAFLDWIAKHFLG